MWHGLTIEGGVCVGALWCVIIFGLRFEVRASVISRHRCWRPSLVVTGQPLIFQRAALGIQTLTCYPRVPERIDGPLVEAPEERRPKNAWVCGCTIVRPRPLARRVAAGQADDGLEHPVPGPFTPPGLQKS